MIHEIKLKKGVMDGHIFNQMIKVYAGAILVPKTTPEHIDQYCEDAWLLYQ